MKARNVAIIMLIPIIILLSNFTLLAFNERYYEKQYEKNNLYSQIPKEQADEATKQLIEYLRDGKELQGDYFNQKEKQHLKDVRNIIRTLLIILGISIIAAPFLMIKQGIKNKKILAITIIAGGLLTILLIVIFFLALTNFESTFIRFHEVMFTNQLWLLDPATDKLIVMYPENFFYEITKNIAVRSLLVALATTFVGITLLLKYKT
ncbi:MAG: TIGR01906 family membrane protein [Candidatus Nanoarchaeia archaeon]